MAKPKYEQEFKNRILRLHLEEGRTLLSLAQEYKVNKATISNWIKAYREECQTNPEVKEEHDYFKENLRLRKQLEELEKENRFLKKAAAFFAKEIE
ncbi:transposase [Clostridium pascui]|nr:transposase [Clostridium pascui]